VEYPQPHWDRRKRIEKDHPEIKKLYGTYPLTAAYSLAIVISQLVLSYLHKDLAVWQVTLSAWCVGAFFSHSLWVIAHDCAHRLVFESNAWNNVFLLISNMPHLIPSSYTFAYFHRLHHSNLGNSYGDPDIPNQWESRLLGHSTPGKIIWLCLLPFLQALRTMRFSSKFVWNRWFFSNVMLNLLTSYLVWKYLGVMPFYWLLISNVFCLGPHMMGARWIAEHYATHPNQETYSYYGGLVNFISFNIGYHNEHHDMVRVPWARLPLVRAMAPEYYSNLAVHPSYLLLLIQFITNDKFTLDSRVVRKWSEGTSQDES